MRKMFLLRVLAATASTLFLAGAASAHRINDTFIRIDADSQIKFEIDIPKNLSPADVANKSGSEQVMDSISSNLVFTRNESPCDFNLVPADLNSTESHFRFTSTVNCEQSVGKLTIAYGLFFNQDNDHRAYIIIEQNDTIKTAVLSPENRIYNALLDGKNEMSFLAFVWEGIWHIWIGFDHILFLMTLLLPSVLVFSEKRWTAQKEFSSSFIETCKIVTAFTVAHSLTLCFATFKILELPSRYVESAIALSVLLVSLNNIFTIFPGHRWKFAAFFGLIHGLGFAAILSQLGLTNDNIFVALLGFNIGVEVGQLVIVGLLMPLLFWARKFYFYQPYILIGGSSICAIISVCWMIDRIAQLDFMPF